MGTAAPGCPDELSSSRIGSLISRIGALLRRTAQGGWPHKNIFEPLAAEKKGGRGRPPLQNQKNHHFTFIPN